MEKCMYQCTARLTGSLPHKMASWLPTVSVILGIRVGNHSLQASISASSTALNTTQTPK